MKIPTFRLTYSGQDITRDLREFVNSISYTDKLSGESSELSIDLSNPDRRWMDSWLPTLGDRVSLTLFYQDSTSPADTLDCGTVELDDIKYSMGHSSPDALRLGGLATYITKTLREVRTKEYENISLKAIAQEIAKRHKLTLVGEIPEVTFKRVTQNEQTDLQFLVRLGEDYGLIIKIENDQLIFHSHRELEGMAIASTLSDATISDSEITYQTKGTYKTATIKYSNPDSKATIEVEIDEEGKVLRSAEVKDEKPDEKKEEAPQDNKGGGEVKSDALVMNDRCENQAQAILKAKEALRKANGDQVTARVSLEGSAQWQAGVNLQWTGIGKFSGKFQIESARHMFSDNQGWRSELELRRIGKL
jgi:uncharacterized protein